MHLHRNLFALSAIIGILIIGGCSSNNNEIATNAPGPPAGPQPGAANTGVKDNNSVDTNSVRR